MAFKKPKVNKITADISTVSIYLRSVKKFGKTTLFRDVIMSKYGDPEKGLLVACGSEIGYSMLDNLNVVHIETYDDLIELGKWLIKEKGKEHDIRIIAFDTVDELQLIADQETIKRYKEDSGKTVKSIKGAFGGFGSGQEYSANSIMKPYFNALKKAGFGIWSIAHTSMKTVKNKGDLEEDGYQMLTSNLNKQSESAFGDVFDIVLTGVIDRTTETRYRDGFNNKKIKENFVKDEVRKLYFRGTTMIDAGSRFADGAVPEYMVFDKQNMGPEFIKVIEEGIEKSKTDFTPSTETKEEVNLSNISLGEEVTEEDIKSIKKEIITLCTEKGGTKNEALMATLKSFVPSGNPNQIRDIAKAKECLAAVKEVESL